MPLMPHLPRHETEFWKLIQRLTDLRKERGMTQAQVGEMMGYHEGVCRLEQRKYTDLRISTLQRWAGAVGAELQLRVKIVDRPKRVDYHALAKTLRDAQRAIPKTSEGARMQAESRARSLEILSRQRGYRPPRTKTS